MQDNDWMAGGDGPAIDADITEHNESIRRPRPLNRSLSNIIELEKRPISPDPRDSDTYEITDKCSVPHCPVHGILAMNSRETKRELIRSRSIVIDGSYEKNSDDGRELGQRGRSISDGHLLKPRCIKDIQKKRIRELRRQSTDNIVQESIEKMDEVHNEFHRRYSSPPRMNSPILDSRQ